MRASRRSWRSLLLAAAVLAALLVTATACGGGGGTAPNTGSSGAATVPVSLTEYAITINGTSLSKGSSMNMKAGKVTFQVTNNGAMVHDFAIQGPGVDVSHPQALQPHQSTTVTVTLQSGSYNVWCTQPGHKDLGMYGVINAS
jgi:uncharacterized cupredoxin-like copper-binding protein